MNAVPHSMRVYDKCVWLRCPFAIVIVTMHFGCMMMPRLPILRVRLNVFLRVEKTTHTKFVPSFAHRVNIVILL